MTTQRHVPPRPFPATPAAAKIQNNTRQPEPNPGAGLRPVCSQTPASPAAVKFEEVHLERLREAFFAELESRGCKAWATRRECLQAFDAACRRHVKAAGLRDHVRTVDSNANEGAAQ